MTDSKKAGLKRSMVWATGVLLVAGCDQRPIVVTPQVIVYLNQQDGSPSQNTKNETARIRLPVCDMEKCDEDDPICAAKVLGRLKAKQSPVWSQFNEKPPAIYTIAARGYYVDPVRKVTFQKSLDSWSELGCVRASAGAETAASEARLRDCVRHMPYWIILANREQISELATDTDFRRVCLRDQP
ncbi:hypothetical protein [Agrobacterium sp. NPDC090273]|uniref:hypothetical protein n=1 Tax=Agrobacterium sp. NPDC090273 TaxID=3363919 RepID=UPI00383A09DE